MGWLLIAIVALVVLFVAFMLLNRLPPDSGGKVEDKK